MSECNGLGIRCPDCGRPDAECLCGTEFEEVDPIVMDLSFGDIDREGPEG